MNRYLVTGTVTISCFVEVDAESEEQARELANRAGMQTLCGSCSYGEPDTWNTSGELDGTPTIEVVEILRQVGGKTKGG